MPSAPTYLERYLAGEHEAVWAELAALGPAVREEPVLADARAVARETMTRVRANLERIVARLGEMGYRFADPDRALEAPDAAVVARLDRLEAALGPVPIALRAFYETVGSVNLMGSHPRLSSYGDAPDLGRMLASTRAALGAHPLPADGAPPMPPQFAALFADMPAETRAMLDNASAMIRELSRRMAQVQEDAARMMTEGGPPSERFLANQDLAASLAAGMQAPPARDPMAEVASDPLVVWPPERDDAGYYREFGDPDDETALDEDGWTGRHAIEIAPDVCHKANQSGGAPYAIVFGPGADAEVLELGAPSFVAYLRESVRWGGFPGLAAEPRAAAAAREELARLTADLVPF